VTLCWPRRVTGHNSPSALPVRYPVGRPVPVLTVLSVAKYRAQARRREIPDARAPGLYLVIQPKPSSAKSWALRFRRPDGRPAKLTLGLVDLSDKETSDEPVMGGALTLRAARQLANMIDRERARGLDVVEERKAARLRQRAAAQDRAANTFGAVTREFFVEYRTKHKQRPRCWRADALALGLRYPLGSDPATTEPEVIKGGLVANWDAKPVAEIDANDVHVIVSAARKRGVPGLGRRNNGASETRGRRMHAALSVLFKWLVRQRKIASNPCADVDRPSAPPDRERVLNEAEVVAFWHACDQLGSPFGPLFKVLLLTGARLREVANMTRDEIGADGVWTIPGPRTKNHKPLSLPLPPLPQQIIAGVTAIESEASFVFTTNGRKPVSGFSKAKRQLDAAMAKSAGGAVPGFRLHDLRRTTATGMAKLRVALPVIEKVLNHVSGSFGGIVGVYQKHEFAAEKAEALSRWAMHVEGLVGHHPAKIVPIRRGK
jgi:integrase